MSNSIIEAQEEYQNFCYHPRLLAPGLRVTHPPGYYTSPFWRRRQIERMEAEEDAIWEKKNRYLVEKYKGDEWDRKLRLDQPP